MASLHDWKMKKIIKTVEKIVEARINQGVLLKELVNSIKFNIKSKTTQEWKDFVFSVLIGINEEREGNFTMNREIKYIKQRLEWFKDLEKEIGCYVNQIESSLKKIERRIRKV